MRYVLVLFLLSCLAVAQNDSQKPSQAPRDSSLSESDRLAIRHRLRLTDEQILETKIDSVDLNNDDIPEIFVNANDSQHCGVVGNCTFWILQKKGNDYKVLLKSIAQSYRVRTVKTGGFADVELGRHDSAYRTEWRGYKYDGKSYVKVKCWANVTGDGEHELPKPKVEPCNKR